MVEKILRLQHRIVDSIYPMTAAPGDSGSGWLKNHRGYDWGMQRDKKGNPLKPIAGANVYAGLPGRIAVAGPYMERDAETNEFVPGPLGLCIWQLAHDFEIGRLRLAYCHLAELFVDEGEDVKAGQVIAVVGNSGFRRDGKPLMPHIHFMPEKLPEKVILPIELPKEGNIL